MAKMMPVLLAEDEQADVFLMERAFRLAGVAHPLVTVADGQQAIWYLQGAGPYADRAEHPEPCLVLLDLKMPIVSGLEVLEWIQKQPALRDVLPVIVLSSSDQETDVRGAFQMGAHDYLVKPMEFKRLVSLVRELNRAWLQPMQAGLPRRLEGRLRAGDLSLQP